MLLEPFSEITWFMLRYDLNLWIFISTMLGSSWYNICSLRINNIRFINFMWVLFIVSRILDIMYPFLLKNNYSFEHNYLSNQPLLYIKIIEEPNIYYFTNNKNKLINYSNTLNINWPLFVIFQKLVHYNVDIRMILFFYLGVNFLLFKGCQLSQRVKTYPLSFTWLHIT